MDTSCLSPTSCFRATNGQPTATQALPPLPLAAVVCLSLFLVSGLAIGSFLLSVSECLVAVHYCDSSALAPSLSHHHNPLSFTTTRHHISLPFAASIGDRFFATTSPADRSIYHQPQAPLSCFDKTETSQPLSFLLTRNSRPTLVCVVESLVPGLKS